MDLFLTYNVGEVVTETLFSNAAILTQGFLQPTLKSAAISEVLDPNKKLAIQLYPNPTSDFFQVIYDVDKPCRVAVISILSNKKEIFEQLKPKDVIATSNWAAGVYICEISFYDNDSKYFRKIVVE